MEKIEKNKKLHCAPVHDWSTKYFQQDPMKFSGKNIICS
jgi:hypothetical protein